MATLYRQSVSKVSPAVPLLVIVTFVSSVGADDRRPESQRARVLMAKQRSGQTLTDEEKAFLDSVLRARSRPRRENQQARPGARSPRAESDRHTRLRIPPREKLFTSVENLARHFDVVYGTDDPRYQVLDAWLVKSDRPGPVLLHFHAGGYIGGNKSEFIGRSSERFETFLKEGISLVSCHYRLAPQYPFPAPLHDTARAVQFVRSKAKDWNIDPDRIAVTGGSAGGQLATWVGLAPDFADPDSGDSVASESSRVTCFIGCGPLYFANIKPVPVQILRVFRCLNRSCVSASAITGSNVLARALPSMLDWPASLQTLTGVPLASSARDATPASILSRPSQREEAQSEPTVSFDVSSFPSDPVSLSNNETCIPRPSAARIAVDRVIIVQRRPPRNQRSARKSSCKSPNTRCLGLKFSGSAKWSPAIGYTHVEWLWTARSLRERVVTAQPRGEVYVSCSVILARLPACRSCCRRLAQRGAASRREFSGTHHSA